MIHLFNEKLIGEGFHIIERNINSELNKIETLNVSNVDDIAKMIAEKLKIEETILHTDQKDNEVIMEQRSGTSARGVTFAHPNKLYDFATVKYSIPFTGDAELFAFKPRHYTNRSYYVEIENSVLKFKIQTEYANADLSDEWKQRVITEANSRINWMVATLSQLNTECASYNDTIKSQVLAEIARRKSDENRKNSQSRDLNDF